MTKKRFFRILLSIVILIVAFDVGMNLCMRWYMSCHTIPGDYKKIEYMFKNVDAQILLMGASVCMNSIKPEILEKELGKRVFNGGVNDQRMEFFDVMTEAIFQYSTPELMILVLRSNDLTVSGTGRLSMMNIYFHCGNTKLDRYLEKGSLKNRILLNSALYRYNSYWWRILLYHFKSFDELAHGGFVAKPVPKYPPKLITQSKTATPPPVDPHKRQCLENILAMCRNAGTRLWIIVPPGYIKFNDGAEPNGLSHIRSFCAQNNILFIDDSQNPDFIDHPEYFFDNQHLNVNGAEQYTLRILRLIQENKI